MVKVVKEHPKLSLRQACSLFGLSTSVFRYQRVPRNIDDYFLNRLAVITETRPTCGFWKLYHRIRLDGDLINHKRLYRIYCIAKLNMRRKTRKRIPKRIKAPLLQPLCPNQSWSMDFMRDSLFHGKLFRAFNVIDDFNREALNITLAHSITSERVIRELDQLIAWRGKPQSIRVDNGPEFIAECLETWSKREDRNIELVFIEKGKPNQNGYIERFNRTYREDILDAYLFDSSDLGHTITNKWMWMYNNERPHESLNNFPPTQFLLKYGKLHPHPMGQQEFPTFQQENIINTQKRKPTKPNKKLYF